MLAALFFAAVLAAAAPLSRRIWAAAAEDDRAGPWESAASVGLVAAVVAVGVDWVLAFSHLLYRGCLVAAAIALLAYAVVARVRSRGLAPRGTAAPALPRWTSVVALSPLGLWLAYVFWRGTVLFAYLSDALSYHLPKALFLVRHHAFGLFEGTDARLTTFPANYELLLADVIALTGKDTLTFAVSELTYVLFGLVVGAMAERWWSDKSERALAPHVLVPVLFALGMPPTLLAAGAHKNDLMTGAAMLAATHWGARWAVTKNRPSLVLAIAGAALAIGTKVNAGVLVPAFVPYAVHAWRSRGRERVSASAWLLWGAFGIAAFVLLGGGVYLFNLVEIGHPIGASEGAGGYGAWDHLWKFPVLVFLRGLTPSEDVWVPWLGVRWAWTQYDLFFAPFGTPTSLLVLALPFAVRRYRAEGRRDERFLASIATVIAFFAVLPVKVNEPPVGFFIGISRYALGAPVVLFLWTVSPLARELSRAPRPAWVASAVVLAASAAFTFAAYGIALLDQGARLGFAVSVAIGRFPPRSINAYLKRAGQVVDELAPPDAVVAFDGGFDSWVYPIFGADLTRRVVFLHPERGPVTIPSNVTWVAIDRWWHCAFGDPRFTDFSQWRYYLKGEPEPIDRALYDQLSADPRFQRVYRSEKMNQAVFVRVAP